MVGKWKVYTERETIMTLTPEELLDLLKYDINTNEFGTTYRVNGELHRDNDQPAITYADGSTWWYKHGEIHRDNDLPAVINADGSKYWHQDGNLHRYNDQPAITYKDGIKYWYQHGTFIRREL